MEHFFNNYQCRFRQSVPVDHLHLLYRHCEDDLSTFQNLGSHHLVVEMQLHLASSDLGQALGLLCIAVANQAPEFFANVNGQVVEAAEDKW